MNDEVTYAPAGSWREQRDRARLDLYDRIGKSVAAVKVEEQRINSAIGELHGQHEVPYTEIAAAIGMTASVVRSRAERAGSE